MIKDIRTAKKDTRKKENKKDTDRNKQVADLIKKQHERLFKEWMNSKY